MGGFVIRVKTKSGQKIVDSLTPQDTLIKLKDKLSELTGVDSDFINVLRGYPPKALDMSNGNATLQDSNITSGETLIIEEKQFTATASNDNKINNDHDTARNHITDSSNFNDCPGILMKMVVPSDNSCLFTSIGFVLSGKFFFFFIISITKVILNVCCYFVTNYQAKLIRLVHLL